MRINSHTYSNPFKTPVTKEIAPDYDHFIKEKVDISLLKELIQENVNLNFNPENYQHIIFEKIYVSDVSKCTVFQSTRERCI